jgi:hypothetical protein
MKVFIKFLALVLLAFFAIGCMTDIWKKEHPKDEKLIENFQSHKEEFNQLLQMFLEDKYVGRIDFDFTRASDFFEKCKSSDGQNGNEIELSKDRLESYRKLFNELGLSFGIEGYCEKEKVIFYASTQGLSVSGSTKGYAYLANPPEKIVDNLDKYWSQDRQSFTAFRHIEGNWYLYFDYED